jgi:hypothetical protein
MVEALEKRHADAIKAGEARVREIGQNYATQHFVLGEQVLNYLHHTASQNSINK